MRTVNKVKSTTTDLRGFADSVDHLLNALEEFFPLIEKVSEKTSWQSRKLLLQNKQRKNNAYRKRY